MPSFDAVNYSLRPNKTIQRLLVFDGLKDLMGSMPWDDALYIGFGSIWFTDFALAHRRLGLKKLISIEHDEIGFRRAQYNCPYRCVEVRHGLSYEVVPEFYEDETLNSRPWIAWFDYDSVLEENSIEELQGFVEDAPENSVLLMTVNASHEKYGNTPHERQGRLATLMGDVVPDVIPRRHLNDIDRFALRFSSLLEDFLVSTAVNCARPGGFVPAFRLPYRDKAAMVTVGGVLPTRDRRQRIARKIGRSSWQGLANSVVVAPHLTLKELAVLQAQLPSEDPITRADVQALGFDLGDDQIEIFSRYYRQYPAFAQISA